VATSAPDVGTGARAVTELMSSMYIPFSILKSGLYSRVEENGPIVRSTFSGLYGTYVKSEALK